MISEGFWSEWRGSNSRPRGPKPRVLSAELHPDIHFSAMIPRRGVKIKFFLSVVIYVVKAAFVPLSAIGGNPANAGATRLCGVLPCPVPDTATALPNHPRYQLRYTRIFSFLLSVVVVKDVVKRLFSEFLGKMQSAKMPVFARGCGISDFARMPGVLHAPKPPALPAAPHPDLLNFLRFLYQWDTMWSLRYCNTFQRKNKEEKPPCLRLCGKISERS